jgi:hypothetical protein
VTLEFSVAARPTWALQRGLVDKSDIVATAKKSMNKIDFVHNFFEFSSGKGGGAFPLINNVLFTLNNFSGLEPHGRPKIQVTEESRINSLTVGDEQPLLAQPFRAKAAVERSSGVLACSRFIARLAGNTRRSRLWSRRPRLQDQRAI